MAQYAWEEPFRVVAIQRVDVSMAKRICNYFDTHFA